MKNSRLFSKINPLLAASSLQKAKLVATITKQITTTVKQLSKLLYQSRELWKYRKIRRAFHMESGHRDWKSTVQRRS